MSSSKDEADNNHIPRGQRAVCGGSSLSTSTGKIFTHNVDANAHFDSIGDYGLAMWRRQDTHQDEPNERVSYLTTLRSPSLEDIFNCQRVPERDPQTLKTLLQDPTHGITFHRKLCRGLAKGRSQARFDDKSMLCVLFLKHLGVKKCASPGWVDHVFDRYMRNEIFIAALQSIFTSLGWSWIGREKQGAKAGMTSISPANMAYVAMMLRFVLHRPGNWDNIKPGRKDKRYDYDAFYLATLSLLKADVYAEEVKALKEFLSRALFPHSYDHPQVVDVPGESSMAQLAAEAERIRAERRANERIQREGAQ
ncbi:hypothetical protein FS749_015343 [Ceratobasidium sp. UAMH 11750]|nr:hypothetical protein FS749_015343 [Ceratobasidium sp. UAMH 11750]